jgi:hypothetical protein
MVRARQAGAEVNRRASTRSALAPALLGALAVFALLLAFQQVVQGAVTQGAKRRDATAQHDRVTWRCKAMPSRQEREDCLAPIGAGSPSAQLDQKDYS